MALIEAFEERELLPVDDVSGNSELCPSQLLCSRVELAPVLFEYVVDKKILVEPLFSKTQNPTFSYREVDTFQRNRQFSNNSFPQQLNMQFDGVQIRQYCPGEVFAEDVLRQDISESVLINRGPRVFPFAILNGFHSQKETEVVLSRLCRKLNLRLLGLLNNLRNHVFQTLEVKLCKGLLAYKSCHSHELTKHGGRTHCLYNIIFWRSILNG